MIATLIRITCVTLLLAATAHAASFDCAKAKTPQEKAICGFRDLSEADDRMAAAYQEVVNAAPDAMVAQIRNDQVIWIHGLAVNCPSDGGVLSQQLVDCLRDYYVSRIDNLRRLIYRSGNVTFVWRSITLTQKNEPGDPESDDDANPGYGTLDASWPQTKGSSPEWQTWNTAIERASQKIAAPNRRAVDGKWDPEWAAGMEGFVNTSIGLVNPQWISATVEYNWTGHGAFRQNQSTLQLNWMLQEKREMRAEDVFHPNSGWEHAVENRCAQQLAKELGEENLPKNIHKQLREFIADPENWKLEPAGLTIVYQPYYIVGRIPPDPITVPWHELQPYLQPSFVLPK
jgi:uncharacterized protein YecT (DUF1311 family)